MIKVKIKNSKYCSTPIDIELYVECLPPVGSYLKIEKYEFVVDKIEFNLNNSKITLTVNTK